MRRSGRGAVTLPRGFVAWGKCWGRGRWRMTTAGPEGVGEGGRRATSRSCRCSLCRSCRSCLPSAAAVRASESVPLVAPSFTSEVGPTRFPSTGELSSPLSPSRIKRVDDPPFRLLRTTFQSLASEGSLKVWWRNPPLHRPSNCFHSLTLRNGGLFPTIAWRWGGLGSFFSRGEGQKPLGPEGCRRDILFVFWYEVREMCLLGAVDGNSQ